MQKDKAELEVIRMTKENIQYYMGIVYPPNADHNILIPFLVKEED